MSSRRTPVAFAAALLASVMLVSSVGASPASARTQQVALAAASSDDSFFTYDGAQPLASYAPGTVLKTRTVQFHVTGIPTVVKVTQLLYRSTDAQGRPAANATSILKPAGKTNNSKVVAYQSFYDSLNPADNPSKIFAGDLTFGGLIANVETVFLAPLLAQGYTVVVADTEGPNANFAAGPEYGYMTLDSIRASLASPEADISDDARVGLLGYSGGAIASNWAATLAPAYAPEVNRRIIGVAEGGLLVAPGRNLEYVNGSLGWAGVAGMALVGVARAYEIDFTPYLSEYGKKVLARLDKASIANVYGQYPGLTWQQLVKPEYKNPSSVPEFVEAVNKLNLGLRPSPTVPMFIGQGAAGTLEGTSPFKPGIGRGDGVMIAGDVRTLARQYCAAGTQVKYIEYGLLSHVGAALAWTPSALTWLNDRFAGKSVPSSCGSIAAGNPLPKQVYQP